MKKKKMFWNLIQNKEDKSADLFIYGEIGKSGWLSEGITSNEFNRQLSSLENIDIINVHINSGGGSVVHAVAIANLLKQSKSKTVAYIDGIAASAATIITSSCDVVRMPKNALFMIHNPSTVAIGESKDMEKAREVLEKMKDNIIETYLSKTKLSKEKLSDLMDKETWLNAEEAKEYGFIDEIVNDEVDLEIKDSYIISNTLAFNNLKKIKNNNVKELKNEEGIIMNKEELLEKYPDIYNEILNEGIEKGVIQERNRIKEIDDLGITDEIVTNAKFVDIKNAKDVSFEILKNKKMLSSDTLSNITSEGKPIIFDKEKSENIDIDEVKANLILNQLKGVKK
ncbi:head maturation protease, ClpP-related [Streptobacillus moniliformis]|uniref:head maturation protease, ClpP-related n=1 Tax=Streptobacillus moniliformis TaxID=34105 RepID=UPI0007E30257|nr:head maturation protease, ClpP-related [Streptobacillus moniliformis]